jgi:acetate---CoA ligase (ADP-forming)
LSRDLRPLFDPRSVAILGASNDPAKWGHWLALGGLKGEHRRGVFLVNRNGGEILGREVYRSLADLPEPPELVVVTVPQEGFEDAVTDSLAAGAKALVGISAGLGETGAGGKAREEAVVERVRAAGAVLLGPNCLGVFDAGAELELASNEIPSGSIGLISQSGNLALELGLLAQDVGLGFSRFASLGNQADLDVVELVTDFAGHEPTQVIALYLEDYRDGRAFASAAQRAVEGGKPVILLPAGTTAAAARAALSHTGALVSDLRAVDAACRAAGIVRVSTPKELIDAAQAFVSRSAPQGRRLAVVADGGGHGVIAADVAAGHEFELVPLSDHLSARLAGLLPATATTRNPVDLAGGGEQDFWSYAKVIRQLLGSDEVDAVLLTGYFGGYSQYSDEFRAREVDVAHALAEAAADSGRPLAVHTMYWAGSAAEALRSGGVPVYREIEAAVHALEVLARSVEVQPAGVPDLPAAAAATAGEPSPAPAASDYWAARELVASVGIEFPAARRAADAGEAAAAAADLGFPVAVKALGLLHKSDAGGVALGVEDEQGLEEALAIMTTLSAEGYSVERMADGADGVELIAGCLRDRRFGPVVLIGLGGIYAELLDDTAVALAPVDAAGAEVLIRSLRGAPLLTGARCHAPLDVTAAAAAVAALSGLAAARPDLTEIEVNPLLVTVSGALGLDARVVSGENGADDAR